MIKHDTFTIERTTGASPERVFEALSKPEIKARWFVGPAGNESRREGTESLINQLVAVVER